MRSVAVRRIGALLLGLGLLSSLGVAPVLGAGIIVNSLLNTAVNDGVCTLREAISAANANLASGAMLGECAAGSAIGADAITFSVAGTISIPTGALIFSDLSISGAGAVTVDGAGTNQVFAMTGGAVTLSGLTISGGDAFLGAAIFNDGATVTVTDSTITGNAAGSLGGGGIYNAGTLTVTNTTISANTTTGTGGGIYSALGATTSVISSTISGNTGDGGGGGIRNNGGTVNVSGSTISGNHTVGVVFGGGIFNTGTMTVTDTAISGNDAFTGGGIANDTLSSLSVIDSTISANTSDAGGGGFNQGTMTVTNTTVSGNASGSGAGIRSAGNLTVTDSTISNNTTTGTGGGGIFATGVLTVTSTTINANEALTGTGGGVFTGGGSTIAITNSTISGNTSDFQGGGIASGGTLALTNSTITGNLSLPAGGGIQGLGTETVVNSIIAGNSTAGAPSGADQNGVLETVTTSIIGVPSGKTLADILVPAGLADNGGPTKTIALALVAGNPAIDTATGATCAAAPVNAVDQRGKSRPAACDIGAYEAQPPTVAAHANVSAPATSSAGAVVSYTPPAGTNEQGVAASVACLPASGSTFAVGSTTVTCTATDAVGHTGTGTFQVVVGSFTLPNTVVSQPGSSSATIGLLTLLGLFGLVGYLGLWRAAEERGRRT